MANVIDEMTGPVNTQGRDINVIEKQIPVKTGFGSVLFEFFLWFPFILPGLIFLLMKIGARNYFKALEQKIQHNASQIDNYRTEVQVLQNVVGLVEKAIELTRMCEIGRPVRNGQESIAMKTATSLPVRWIPQ